MPASKLTPEVQERVVRALAGGASGKVAARHAGIGPTAHYQWVDRGRRALARTPVGRAVAQRERRYADYATEVDTAQREWELGRLANITLAGAGTPYETTRTTTRREADGASSTVTVVTRGSRRDWKADAWLLEKRIPETYMNRLGIETLSAEQQGVLIARAVEGALAELGVERSPRVGEVVARHLSLVADEADEAVA